MDDTVDKKLMDALLSRACGYKSEDVVEEYMVDGDGNYNLSKKKISRKEYPPDISAINKIMDILNPKAVDYDAMSDQDLQDLKEQIEQQLIDE